VCASPRGSPLKLFGYDSQLVQRLHRGLLLGRLLRRASADAELHARDVRGAHEPAVVRRPLDLEDRVVHLLPRARERLLELSLVVHVARARVLDLLGERGHDRGLDPLEPVLEVERRDRCLEHGGEDVPAPRDALELVGGNGDRILEQLLSERELLRDQSAALPRDDVRPDLGEPSFRGIGEAVEDRTRDRQLEDAVAEELEALVGEGAVVRPRRVREDLLEAGVRQLRNQAAELPRAAGRPFGAPTPGVR
jgi:hypothetical protein